MTETIGVHLSTPRQHLPARARAADLPLLVLCLSPYLNSLFGWGSVSLVKVATEARV